MNVEIIEIKHYQNAIEYSMLYTIRDKDGKFPLANGGGVDYRGSNSPIGSLKCSYLGKPCQKGNLELCVYEIDGEFAVYDENHTRITQNYAFIDDLIEEIWERDLKIFDFEPDEEGK